MLHGGVGEPGIPFFEPFDDSSISVLDVKSELQSAAVKYGVAWEDLGAFLYILKALISIRIHDLFDIGKSPSLLPGKQF